MKVPIRSLTFLAVAIIITLTGSLISLKARVSVESRNKATALSAEWQTIQDLCATSHMTIEEALSHLKQQGLTHVVLTEDTVNDLIQSGDVTIPGPRPVEFPGTTFRGGSSLARIQAAAKVRFGTDSKVQFGADAATLQLPATVTLTQLRTLPVGLDPQKAALVRNAGLGLIARHTNAPGMDHAAINWTLDTSRKLGATIYLPVGDQVLGQRELVEDTAQALTSTNMLYATVEFSKTAGDAILSRLAKDRLVRLHSIQKEEVDKLTPREYNERFVKASRERSMRVLLLRPLTVASNNGIRSFGETINGVKSEIVKEGGAIGTPKPFVEPHFPQIAFVLIGLGILLASIWTAGEFFPDGLRFVRTRPLSTSSIGISGAWIGGILGGLALLCSLSSSFRGLTAVGGALVFPLASYACWMRIRQTPVIVQYLTMSFISLVGGLTVAGSLNSLDYYVRIRQFEAVKIAHFLPLVIIGLWLLSSMFNFKDAMKSPMTYGSLALGMVGIALIGFMLMRTGNDNPAGVSGLELKMRSVLEHFLYVRPRTKEIFIGHPALVFGLMAQAWKRKQGSDAMTSIGVLAVTLGAIGQTSIVNTLCHIHTPLELGIARIGIGLLIGGVFGFIAFSSYKSLFLGKVHN